MMRDVWCVSFEFCKILNAWIKARLKIPYLDHYRTPTGSFFGPVWNLQLNTLASGWWGNIELLERGTKMAQVSFKTITGPNIHNWVYNNAPQQTNQHQLSTYISSSIIHLPPTTFAYNSETVQFSTPPYHYLQGNYTEIPPQIHHITPQHHNREFRAN